MPTVVPTLFNLKVRQTHNDTRIVAEHPLEVITPSPQWSYAVWTNSLPQDPPIDASARVAITVRLRVTTGRVGVGWTRAGSDEFVSERYFAREDEGAVVVHVPAAALPGRLMFRNVSPSGPSQFVLDGIDARVESGAPPYPVSVEHRSAHSDATAPEQGRHVFDDDRATSINRARLDFLARLDLQLAGKRVLDAGCGVGHHTTFYTSKGCTVVGVDGRAENIAVMKELYPQVEGIAGDVQEMDLDRLGSFDIVHCFGLLYHLDSPVVALRRLAKICREYLFLETMVCDSSAPVMVLADEPFTSNQALGGLGCRPSPSLVAMALDRLGFRHIYGTTAPPAHPDFLFEWKNNLDIIRGGHNLRCVFVASRSPVRHETLVELVSD
jgi:SAM-dependent methyltransferase